MKKTYKHDIKEKTIFQQRLIELRHEKGLTGEKLASCLHVSRACVVDWENKADRQPATDKLILLADFFGVSLDYLVGRSSCRSVDNEYIHQQLGLSEKAINKLKTMLINDKRLIESNSKNQKRIADKKDNIDTRPLLLPLHIDTVNFLVESKLFLNLINTLSYFLNSDKFSKFLDSHFKKIDTDSLYPADENYICGSFDIPINSDTQKALAKNLLDIQLNKLSEEFKKKGSGKK